MTANTLRTFILLAALTGLFMAVGYLIGGSGGALIALVIAGGMNLFAYWNADKMVLRMHGAREITPEERNPALRQFASDTVGTGVTIQTQQILSEIDRLVSSS